MKMTAENRKRSRDEDLNDASMPLSKRINNLHIHNSASNFMKINQNSNNSSVPSRENNVKSDAPVTNGYNPDLNASQNPFYYQNNKVLFELYMERMQRNGAFQFG
ncbi:uncharacterized protein LOC113373681 [Ctenocephalides felis]|uniref:uncharacterized protein LOC113373681 n=1 Tax=Ctenocephalides felis TaxID=7515 RepID=UPI000E6E24F3|nr:uncharacterized protein LOC113373681 [Ctenocephalides felis]